MPESRNEISPILVFLTHEARTGDLSPVRRTVAAGRFALVVCLTAVIVLASSNDSRGQAQRPRTAASVAPAATTPGNGRKEEEKLVVRLVDHLEFATKTDPSAIPMSESFLTSGQPGCSTIGPQSPCPVRGFHCVGCPKCRMGGQKGWRGAGPIPWQAFGHGEYIGPARLAHVPDYRIRVDDQMDFVFRLTRRPSEGPYKLDVGDTIRVESLTAGTVPADSGDPEVADVDRDVQIQPDGSITLRHLGQVPAAGLTIDELRADLEERFKIIIKEPSITVSPVTINTRLEELRASVDNRFGAGGQSRAARVTPEGTIQLPAIGSVRVQGLTLDETKREIDSRYNRIVTGLEVTPILQARAPRFVYVVGEVSIPGRYTLEGPTTVMQAISLAGGWNVGGNLHNVVVFRRDYNWNLMATKLNIFGALYGRVPCPADEIWLRDSDIVLIPKRSILVADDLIELVFTRGLYGVFPLQVGLNFAKLNSI